MEKPENLNSTQEHIGVCIIVLNKKHQILQGRRKNAYKTGCYGLPGGRIEITETITDAIKRELSEEAGIQANEFTYLGVVREFQESYNFIHFGFLLKNYDGTVENKEPEKCEKWEWFFPDQLPDSIIPGHKAIIDLYFTPRTENYQDLR